MDLSAVHIELYVPVIESPLCFCAPSAARGYWHANQKALDIAAVLRARAKKLQLSEAK